jgi:hypothetical protein
LPHTNVQLRHSEYRFICWIYQSAKYSAQCNILAFVYVKRIITSHRILHMRNWRGLWLGAIIIAQKFADDKCLRTGSFASILPGVTKNQLKAAELSVYQLLNYTCHVKPSVFAGFYFGLRSIFMAITGQTAGSSKAADGRALQPLRRAEALRLYDVPGEPSEALLCSIHSLTMDRGAQGHMRPQPAVLHSTSSPANADCGKVEMHINAVREHTSTQYDSGAGTSSATGMELSSAEQRPCSREQRAITPVRLMGRVTTSCADHTAGVRALNLEDDVGELSKSIFVIN